jgi:hypothetical protein
MRRTSAIDALLVCTATLALSRQEVLTRRGAEQRKGTRPLQVNLRVKSGYDGMLRPANAVRDEAGVGVAEDPKKEFSGAFIETRVAVAYLEMM